MPTELPMPAGVLHVRAVSPSHADEAHAVCPTLIRTGFVLLKADPLRKMTADTSPVAGLVFGVTRMPKHSPADVEPAGELGLPPGHFVQLVLFDSLLYHPPSHGAQSSSPAATEYL